MQKNEILSSKDAFSVGARRNVEKKSKKSRSGVVVLGGNKEQAEKAHKRTQ